MGGSRLRGWVSAGNAAVGLLTLLCLHFCMPLLLPLPATVEAVEAQEGMAVFL